MKELPPVEVPFPEQGLVTSVSLDAQPPLTTPDALNVRGFDPLSGRSSGAQRSGLSRVMSQPAVGVNVPIQDLDFVVSNRPTADPYAGVFAHPADLGDTGIKVEYWPGSKYGITSNLARSYGQCYGLLWDSQGNLYAVLNNDPPPPPP